MSGHRKLDSGDVTKLLSFIFGKEAKFSTDSFVLSPMNDGDAKQAVLSLKSQGILSKEALNGVVYNKKPFYTCKDHSPVLVQDGEYEQVDFCAPPKGAKADIAFSEAEGLSIAADKIDQDKLLVSALSRFEPWSLAKRLGDNEKTKALVTALNVRDREIAPLDPRSALNDEAVDDFRKKARGAAEAVHKAAEDAGIEKIIGKRAAKFIVERLSGLSP